MPRDITEFASGESVESMRLKRFFRLKRKLSNKQELRKLETELLKPKTLVPYLGKMPTRGPLRERTIKLVFGSLEDVKKFESFVKVNNYVEKNCRDTDLIVELCECLERGSLVYDKEEKKLQFVDDRGDRYQL